MGSTPGWVVNRNQVVTTWIGDCLWTGTPSRYITNVNSAGLAGFCQKVEKTGFFHGKNRTGKNCFCRQKIGFCQNIFFYTFITIKYCCNAYIILTSISVLNSTLIVLVTYLSLTNGIVTPTPKLLGTNPVSYTHLTLPTILRV